jgi:hypothetical protein
LRSRFPDATSRRQAISADRERFQSVKRSGLRVLTRVGIILFAPALLCAQHDEHALPASFDQPIRLYTSGLGSYSHPISSSNADARAYFNQGFQLMYAFAKAEAGRSFREAQRRDPTCAICYWGEAWAWGPYVNGRMTPRESARAVAAIQQAASLADRHANAEEKMLIAAMAARYVDPFDPAAHPEQDRAYAAAMARVAAAYPDDLDVATLYAEALFLLLPRPGSWDLANPDVARLVSVLEAALQHDIRHVGACHLYIHTTELTSEPQRAEACASRLAGAMPAASHLEHMPSHTWARVGRWNDAVRASLQAWQADQKASSGAAIATYPAHDLQMLVLAACMDGQGELAIRAGRGLATLTGDPVYHALALVRFGRFDEIGAVGERPDGDLQGGVWDFAQGYARLRRRDLDGARRSLDRLVSTAQTSRAAFRFHEVRILLGVLAGILEGELARSSGDSGAAVRAFERAVTANDSIIVDDPEPLPFAARHWLGAELLDVRRFADAERVFRADLVRHPHNGWSLVGLRDALRAQGRATGAVEADLRSSWARSDTLLHASRF